MSDSPALGLCAIITLLLAVLKLTGKITLSWWWVLAPLWAPLAIFLGLALLAALALWTFHFFEGRKRRG